MCIAGNSYSRESLGPGLEPGARVICRVVGRRSMCCPPWAELKRARAEVSYNFCNGMALIKAVYPGTFDPLTRGHEDLVRPR